MVSYSVSRNSLSLEVITWSESVLATSSVATSTVSY